MSFQSYFTSLECTFCGEQFEPSLHTLCPSCNKVLFSRYDLKKAKSDVKASIQKSESKLRSYNIWRYPEVMPVKNPANRLTLGEGWTPLLKLHNSEKHFGISTLYLKDEGQNPTGTFKSRGLCVAVSKAIEFGVTSFIIPTAGNAGAALSAYATHANLQSLVVMPEDTPNFIQTEVIALGGKVKLVSGTISDAAATVKDITRNKKYFDVSTLKEPYRVEGKKTMAYEVIEQLNWNVPDVFIYPTGGGTGIVGMWKAFSEMMKLGMIREKKPKMVAVQAANCAPIVKAFNEGKKFTDPWKDAKTIAPGLRVPKAVGDYLILEAIRESKGTAVAINDDEIIGAMKNMAKREGIMLAPEAAAPYAALKYLQESNFLKGEESIILFGTGSGLLYPELW
ncbi:MAG: threonine synthase [Candidatus Hodarchaeales archaeon]|jgi:threonine synthase